ncbi:dynamin family protein, partial [Desulfatirhabdium butyrativorans]|uniref:dynamin family protein n=1 Tax=Desulfatirhabdium butyrativorans TaxID=340467 RepID=UPI0012EB4430
TSKDSLSGGWLCLPGWASHPLKHATLPGRTREITIVDTPGTNSIVREHQAITEHYLPQSDLVIFVFPARNPYTHTAWELLSVVRSEWHRKTVFVLQQADLVTQSELVTHRERLIQYARQRHVQEPVVFTVSAKREMEGAADSGFSEFRQFLRDTVQSGEVWQIKWQGALDTVRHIIGQIGQRLQTEKLAILSDRTFFAELLARVASRREKGSAFRNMIVENLCTSYERLTRQLEQDIVEGLGMGNLIRRAMPFSGGKGIRSWTEKIEASFEEAVKRDIEVESLRIAQEIVNEMGSLFQELMEAIALRQRNSPKLVIPSGYDRSNVLERMRTQLELLRVTDMVYENALAGSDIGRLTLAGGGLAIVGAVIAFSTHLVVFDITGGVMATLGALVMVLTMVWKRAAIIREIATKLARSREDFRQRLDQEISQILDRLFLEIEQRLKEPLAQLDQTAERLDAWIAQTDAIGTNIRAI